MYCFSQYNKALLEFFQIVDEIHKPTANGPQKVT